MYNLIKCTILRYKIEQHNAREKRNSYERGFLLNLCLIVIIPINVSLNQCKNS